MTAGSQLWLGEGDKIRAIYNTRNGEKNGSIKNNFRYIDRHFGCQTEIFVEAILCLQADACSLVSDVFASIYSLHVLKARRLRLRRIYFCSVFY